jgi:hypothetical protein
MKTSRMIKVGAASFVVASLSLAVGSRFLPGQGVQAALAAEKTARISDRTGAFPSKLCPWVYLPRTQRRRC